MEKLKWITVQRQVKDLVPLDYNPRKLTEEKKQKLLASLEKFDVVEIPVVNIDNTIIAGNQRVKVLMDLARGEELIDVRLPNRALTEEELKEYNITSNTHVGIWDVEILEEVFSDIDLEGLGIDASIFDNTQNIELNASEDDYQPYEGIQTDIVKGDVFEFIAGEQKHVLLCGDSTLEENYKLLFGDVCPVLMVTDPPYGVNYDPEWRMRTKSKSMNRKSIALTSKVLNDDRANWLLAYSYFEGDVMYVWHGAKASHHFAVDIESVGFELKYQIIWNKNNGAIGRGDIHWKHEACWYAVRKGKPHNWQGRRDVWSVWDIQNLSARNVIEREGQTGHSTQKPIECMARPIEYNSTIGDYIYDPFLGSGTTMVAAHQLQRNCFGIELSEQHCQMIVDRMLRLDPDIQLMRNGIDVTAKYRSNL